MVREKLSSRGLTLEILSFLRGQRILNLGCGEDPYGSVLRDISEDYLTVDVDEEVNPDVVYDLNDGLPVDVVEDFEPSWIFANQVLKHLENPNERINEWEKYSPNLFITVPTPWGSNIESTTRTLHLTEFTPDWFDRRGYFVSVYDVERFPKRFFEALTGYGFFKQFSRANNLLAIKGAWMKYLIQNSFFNYVNLKIQEKLDSLSLKFYESQTKYYHNLREKDEFTLIVLDACRFDMFKKLYSDYLEGDLKKVKSSASVTIDWIKDNLTEFDGVVYSANHLINSDLVLENLGGWHLSDFDYQPDIDRVVDVWKEGVEIDCWRNKNATTPKVLRNEVQKDIENGNYGKKNIIWFIQPHMPFLNSKDLLNKYTSSYHNNVKVPIWFIRKNVNGEIPMGVYKEGYINNLKFVLEEVAKLIPLLGGNVYITADHGEMLGEHSFFAHFRMKMKELRLVPWFKVTGSQYEVEDLEDMEIEESNVKDRLRQLGYI